LSNSSGDTRRSGFFGTVGVFTPLHGCSAVTWLFSAVVKIPLRIDLLSWMVAGERPRSCWSFTQARTSLGRISIIRSGPNQSMMCA
jgi:hypothetical protein